MENTEVLDDAVAPLPLLLGLVIALQPQRTAPHSGGGDDGGGTAAPQDPQVSPA